MIISTVSVIDLEENMGLRDDLTDLVEKLNHIHSTTFNWSEERDFPDYFTAKNGAHVHFTTAARKATQKISETLYANRPADSIKIELSNYGKIIQQLVADLYAEDEFSNFSATGDMDVIGKLKALAEERFPPSDQIYTHYFPAWTVGFERLAPLKLGPVTFWNRTDWINAVDFPPRGKEEYLNATEANLNWKSLLIEALQRPKAEVELDGLAAPMYTAISTCPALLGITIKGYEKDLSRKLAKLVCKTALDSVSLTLGASEFFYQQALAEERLPPVGSDSIIETNGFLWLPGSSLSKRIPILSGKLLEKASDDIAPILPAISSILEGLVSPNAHSHPKLAHRWATALDWFGEANRESSDLIAVAKLGTCLDVLACGGQNAGICEMIVNLTGKSRDTIVVNGDRQRTLQQLVKEIYDDGRSKILHGTHVDRLKSLARERHQAAHLAKIALLECALRLPHYSGIDSDKAFRTMAPGPKN